MSQPPYDPNYVPNYLPPRRSSNPWKIVAIVLASCLGVGIVASAVLAALLFPVFSRARDAARRTGCASNLKQLSTALAMYTSDYDNAFPPANTWQDGLQPYLVSRTAAEDSSPPPNVLECPSRRGVIPGYAFNSNLAGKDLFKIGAPHVTPALFDSSRGTPNASDALGSFVMPHLGKGNVGFVDGSVRGLDAVPPAGGEDK